MINALVGVKGKRICFLGNISHKKGPMALIFVIQMINDYDPEFTYHWGGRIDDPRYAVYFDSIIPKLGLQDKICYHGYIDDPISWFKNFDFILCTSPLEGCPVGILQGLSCGLTPIIYSFVGAENLYPPDFIFKNNEELLSIIKRGPGKPKRYQNFVKNHFSLDKQLKKIDKIVENLLENAPKTRKIPKKSTVSAVIAVKNGEKTISKTIQSLLDQTYSLQKIIVVNDGSADNTENVVRGFFDSSEVSIDILTNTNSKWVFSARNEGFKYVESDYFFFLDADDWMDPTYVEKAVEMMDLFSEIDIVYPDMIYFDDNPVNDQVMLVPEFDPQILVQRNFIAYASMQRTPTFKNISGYSEYLNDYQNHLTEWDLWLRYVKTGAGFKRLAEPLFHYHTSNEEQMSSNYERPRQDMHLQMAIGLTEGGKDIQMNDDKKHILLVCQGRDYLDKSKVGFEVMTWCKPLEEFGEVYTFFYDVETQYYGKDQMLERLKTFADLVKPTYIFHPSYREDIPIDVWKKISEKYCTMVWHSDDDRRFADFSNEYGGGFRYSITTYPEIYEKMLHSGRILSQWAANEHYFKPAVEKDIDVSFVGQNYGDREKLLGGVGITKYGKGWDAGFIDFKEMASILGRSKISISLAGGADGKRQLKLRTFEICASGALCLCEYTPGIEEYYETEKEIVTFSDRDSMIALIDYYLNHDGEREEIALAGYKRTMKEHLWKHRLKEIFAEINKEN